MAEERKSRWGEPPAESSSASATGAAATTKSPDAKALEAAQIAAKITASLRPGVAGTELIKRHVEETGFIRDIEVNDLRNRYVLTKGSTQKQIAEETGASIETRGVWVPDRSRLAPGEIPLYLHIVGQNQAILDAAVGKITELINQDLGPLIDDRTMVARNRALGLPMPAHLDVRGRPKWPEAKLPIGLDNLRNFNVRAKTVGPGGMFVKYIQAETGARVQIKGIGSGFLENETGREADEPLHINIAAPNQDQVERARGLAEDLLIVLREEYTKARDGTHNGGAPGVYQPGHGTYAPTQQQQQQQQPQHAGYPQQGGQQDPYAGYYAQQNGQQQQQQPAQADPSQQGQAPAGGIPQQGTEQWQQYAAYWAAYGYDVNDPQFQAWQASQYGQQQQAA